MDRDALDRDTSDCDALNREALNREARSPFWAGSFPTDEGCEETRSVAGNRDRFAAGATPESELAQLTAAGGPLRRTLGAICARLLDTQAIERLCYARLRDYAERVSGQRLREDEALEWVTAEALSAVSIDASRIGEPEPARARCVAAAAAAADDDEPPLDKCVRAPVPVPDALAEASASIDPLLAGLDEADAFELCLANPARAQDPIPEGEQQLCAAEIDVETTERLDGRAPREVASLLPRPPPGVPLASGLERHGEPAHFVRVPPPALRARKPTHRA